MPGSHHSISLACRTFHKVLLPLVLITLLLCIQPYGMKHQTIRQRLLQFTYPAFLRITKLWGKNNTLLYNSNHTAPKAPVHALSVTLNSGQQLQLEQYRGRKLLLVNTASDCGYTGQYEELQQLWNQHKNHLEVIGFPANDFKKQERGNDAAIAAFCKLHFGIQFPLAQKSSVTKGPQQNPVFAWLTHAELNGWNDHAPEWNFAKYLIDENGVLTHYFGPSISPLGPEVQEAIKQQ